MKTNSHHPFLAAWGLGLLALVLSADQSSVSKTTVVGRATPSAPSMMSFVGPRVYEFQESSLGQAIAPAMDGGYYIGGRMGYSSAGGYDDDAFVLKTGPSGDFQWGAAFGSGIGDDMDEITSLVPTPDGGCLALGYEGRNYDTTADILAIKFGPSGSFDWTKVYESDRHSDALGYGAAAAADGGFFVAGQIGRYSQGLSPDGWVLKLNASGNIVWQKAIGGPDTDCLYSILSLPGGDSLAVGSSGGGRIWLVRFDSRGSVRWQKGSSPEAGGWSELRSIVPATDGGFVAVGSHGTPGDNGLKIAVFVLKIDGNGNIVWGREFSGSNSTYGRSLAPTSGGGYIVLGHEDGRPVSHVLKLDGSGSLQWQMMAGSAEKDMSCLLLGACRTSLGAVGLTGGLAGKTLVMMVNDIQTVIVPCFQTPDSSLSQTQADFSLENVSLAATTTTSRPHAPSRGGTYVASAQAGRACGPRPNLFPIPLIRSTFRR